MSRRGACRSLCLVVASVAVSVPAPAAEPQPTDLVERAPTLALPLRAKALLGAPAVQAAPEVVAALVVTPAARFLERGACSSCGARSGATACDTCLPETFGEAPCSDRSVRRTVEVLGKASVLERTVLVVRASYASFAEDGCVGMIEDETTHLFGFVYTRAGALIDVFPLAAVAGDQARVRRRFGTLTATGDLTLAAVEVDCLDPAAGNCGLGESDRRPLRFALYPSGNACAGARQPPKAGATFEDPKSKEQLVLARDCDGKASVGYRSRPAKPVQPLAVTASAEGGALLTAEFNGARGEYVLTLEAERVRCRNPDGSVQEFVKRP